MTISRIIIWCALVVLGTLNAVQAARLLCYKKGSLQDPISVSLDNCTAILNTSCYDSLISTIIYSYGFRGMNDGPQTKEMLEELLKAGQTNVGLLDWQKEASDNNLGTVLGYAGHAAPNAVTVGLQLCKCLVDLADAGISPVHLIGHSLGAHVMGHTSRCVISKGKIIQRITGLDPARQLYEGFPTVYQKLDQNCAKFVDIVHCNPGKYGVSKPSGTVDLWPNYNDNGLQPGCPQGNFPMFSPEDLCSHIRCVDYYVESVANSTAFPASKAANYNAWVAQNGVSNDITNLGEYTNTSKQGSYYLSTYSQSPYSKGTAGLKP